MKLGMEVGITLDEHIGNFEGILISWKMEKMFFKVVGKTAVKTAV